VAKTKKHFVPELDQALKLMQQASKLRMQAAKIEERGIELIEKLKPTIQVHQAVSQRLKRALS
jgi:hypothetical protein